MRARGSRPASMLLAVTLVACEGGDVEGTPSGPAATQAAAASGPDGETHTDPSLVLADVSGAPAWPVPPGAPDRFGFGVAADGDRIARWDVDVRPDGRGLPPGRGDARAGAEVWREQCAACHGPTGTEGPNDRLVGREPREGFPFGADRSAGPRTVGNYWPYATTLYDYVTRAMPQNAPGSLTADETYAVVAWILARNEIVPEDAVMDAITLPAVRMPAAGRFVPDDRRGGAVVR